MTRLRLFLLAWWPLLLPLAALAMVLAATFAVSITAAVLVVIVWLQASVLLASSVGALLRRRAADYPPVEAAPEAARP
jgi:hypothetical protein